MEQFLIWRLTNKSMARYNRPRGPKRRKVIRNRRRYLIVSEDSKSSVDYLKSFPHDEELVEIVTEGGAGDPARVVKTGIALQKEAKKSKEPFIEVYCVFDRDDHESYQQAFDLIKGKNSIKAIWSNECFELWYLLHFEFRNSGMERKEIYSKLNELLGREYDKGDISTVEHLKNKMEQAHTNAAKLLEYAYDENPQAPWMVNPSTKMHELVQKLIELNQPEEVQGY